MSLLQLLTALIAIVVAARLCARLCARLGQPPVMGEVLAGIALGPSLLGHLAPQVGTFLFPATIVPVLGLFAQIGVVLYMFVVGLELDPALLRRRSAWAISQAAIVLPFALGGALAVQLHDRFAPAGVPLHVFVLFCGVSMSVTAFPVLARILDDLGVTATPIGQLALSSAAIGDVVAWCLLALVVSIAQGTPWQAAVTFGLSLLYVAFMFVVVRPILRRLASRDEGDTVFALVIAALLLSALATELIGVHALFGAFLFGALVPMGSPLARTLETRVRALVATLLLPVFFVVTGLRTEIGLVSGELWWWVGALVLVASVGKIAGAAIAARLAGETWRDSTALGVLMNTRGLMELIVLNLGLSLGVLSPTLFAMFAIVALVTTFATTPLFVRLEALRPRPAPAE